MCFSLLNKFIGNNIRAITDVVIGVTLFPQSARLIALAVTLIHLVAMFAKWDTFLIIAAHQSARVFIEIIVTVLIIMFDYTFNSISECFSKIKLEMLISCIYI